MDDHDESTANVGMNNIALAIRDKVRELRRKYPYSDAMMGTIDPYSGQPIRNREDYEDYLISYASAPFTQWNNPVIFSGKTSQPVDVSKAPLDRSKADPLPQNNSPDTELPTKSHRITWPQIKLIAGKEEAMVFDNPFYVLSALPCDDRKRIIQLCDEKSLLQNADKCIEARNTLINPQKRLSAEVRWFMGCQSSAIIELLAHLVQYRDGVAIERKLDVTLNPILNLNYNLAIFVYSASRENELIPVRIVEICSVFNKIDPVAVMLLINDSRKEANIPQLNNKSDVEAALNNLRDDIKNIVTKVFTSLPQQNVTSILTTIMSVNDGHKSINGSVIMEDLIAWYALYTHDLEDEMNQDVLLELKTIENSQDSKNLKTQLETLIAHIRNWNNLVKPIQLLSRSQGIRHASSEKMFAQLRELALTINNEWLMPEFSLMFAQSLKDIFTDLPEAAEQLYQDVKKLKEITKEKEKIEDEVRRQKTHFQELEQKYKNDYNNRYAVEISGQQIKIPKRCLSCCQPTDSEEQVSGINFYLCSECREKRSEARKEREKYKIIRSKKVTRAVISTIVTSLFMTAIVIFFLKLYNVDQNYAVIVVLSLPSVFLSILRRIKHIESDTTGYLRVEDAPWDPLLSIDTNKHYQNSVFQFANGVYAELFAEANKSKSIPKEVSIPRIYVKHPEKKSLKKFMPSATAIYVVVILISIGIVALFNEMYYSIPTEFISQEFRSAIGAPATSEQTVKPTTSKPTTKPISIPTAKIVRMFEVTKPANGSASYYTGNAAKDTSVGITVPSGKNFYLITLADAKTNKKAVKIFVYPGETVNTEIPSGTYRLYYTYGDKWYGIIDEFGPDAVKFRSKESDTFSSNSGGWDYTLKPVTYGNMQTEEVNASDYPI